MCLRFAYCVLRISYRLVEREKGLGLGGFKKKVFEKWREQPPGGVSPILQR
jgi:hypothetical protein